MSTFLENKKIFIVGIKGVGMANLAIILKQMGNNVLGSDSTDRFITDTELAQNSITVTSFDPSEVPEDTQILIYSASHKGALNSQVAEAKKRNILVFHQAEIIEQVANMHKTSIAVCGSHGKTGTTCLLAHILDYIEKDKVSYLAGTSSFNGHPAGKYGDGSIFVFEADEYGMDPPDDKTPKFSLYNPDYIICTNIDFDHPDVYKNLDNVEKAFKRFFSNAKKKVFACQSKKLKENENCIVEFLKFLGYPFDKIQRGIETFKGVKRRFEKVAEINDVKVFDDYAHHPKEIEVTLATAKEKFPLKRIVIVFQPHTYSRTEALIKEFHDSLEMADLCLLAPIFSSARESSEKFMARSEDIAGDSKKILCFKNRENLIRLLKENLKKNDVVFTMGAGDVYKLKDAIIEVAKGLPNE